MPMANKEMMEELGLGFITDKQIARSVQVLNSNIDKKKLNKLLELQYQQEKKEEIFLLEEEIKKLDEALEDMTDKIEYYEFKLTKCLDIEKDRFENNIISLRKEIRKCTQEKSELLNNITDLKK